MPVHVDKNAVRRSHKLNKKKKDHESRLRKPSLVKLYTKKRPPLRLDSQRFRIWLLRGDAPRGRQKVRCDGIVETLEWRSEPGDPVLQGSVTIRKPRLGGRLAFRDGHQLRVDVRWGGKWRELWRMRLYDGEHTLENVFTFQLADDGRMLQEGDEKWEFTKSKKAGRPKGWLCHEILMEVARQYRIPLGHIAEGTHYITDLSGKMSPMQVIQKAYAIEKRHTDRKFVIRWKNGKLHVVPLRRNSMLYVLGPQIRAAVIKRTERGNKFATAVTVRASIKQKGSSKKKKLVLRHVDEKAVAREGFIHREIGGDDVKDWGDALKKAKVYIKDHGRRAVRIEGIEHYGIAFLRRGDAIRIAIPGFDFQDKNGKITKGYCFVSSGVWTLQGGEFLMAIDVTIEDPYADPKARKDKKDKHKREEKREKRKNRDQEAVSA